jgi:hypothetical protein
MIKNAGMGVDILYKIYNNGDPLKRVKNLLRYIHPGLVDRVWLFPILSD